MSQTSPVAVFNCNVYTCSNTRPSVIIVSSSSGVSTNIYYPSNALVQIAPTYPDGGITGSAVYHIILNSIPQWNPQYLILYFGLQLSAPYSVSGGNIGYIDVNGNQHTVSFGLNGPQVQSATYIMVIPVVSQITNTLVYNFSFYNGSGQNITSTLSIYAISFVSDITNKVYTIFFAPYNNSNSYTINFSQTLNSSGSALAGITIINNSCDLNTLNMSASIGSTSLPFPYSSGNVYYGSAISISSTNGSFNATVQSNGNQCVGNIQVLIPSFDPNTYNLIGLTGILADIIATPVYPESQTFQGLTATQPSTLQATLDLNLNQVPNANFTITPSLNITSSSLSSGYIEFIIGIFDQSGQYNYGYSYGYYGYGIYQNFNQSFNLLPGVYQVQTEAILNNVSSGNLSGSIAFNIIAQPT